MLLPFIYNSTSCLQGTVISCFLIGKWNNVNDSVCMHVYQDMVVVNMFLFAFI